MILNGWNVAQIIRLERRRHNLSQNTFRLIFTLSNMRGDCLSLAYHVPDVTRPPQIIKDLAILSDTKEWCEFLIAERTDAKLGPLQYIQAIKKHRLSQEELEFLAAAERLKPQP